MAAEAFVYDKMSSGYLNLKNANYEMLVPEVRDHQLIRPTLIRRDNQGRNDLFIMAEKADLQVDFPNGKLIITMYNVDMIEIGGKRGVAKAGTWSVPLSAIEEAP